MSNICQLPVAIGSGKYYLTTEYLLAFTYNFQHMSSNKHRRLSVALQSHMGEQQANTDPQSIKRNTNQLNTLLCLCFPDLNPSNTSYLISGGQSSSSGSGRSKWWSEGGVTKESLAGASSGRECNVREIPMLSMFLQRLHQHHYFPPIRVRRETKREEFRKCNVVCFQDEEDVSSETHR